MPTGGAVDGGGAYRPIAKWGKSRNLTWTHLEGVSARVNVYDFTSTIILWKADQIHA